MTARPLSEKPGVRKTVLDVPRCAALLCSRRAIVQSAMRSRCRAAGRRTRMADLAVILSSGWAALTENHPKRCWRRRRGANGAPIHDGPALSVGGTRTCPRLTATMESHVARVFANRFSGALNEAADFGY
jgi:hypothetical protein